MRVDNIREMMRNNGFDAVLVGTNANLYYLTGGVFSGYVYIPAEGEALQFVRRPVDKKGDGIVHIRKPEQIIEYLGKNGLPAPRKLALELDGISYTDALRCQKAFGLESVGNCSPLLAQARSVKSDFEISLLRESGAHHCGSYRRISGLYHEGMTDIELQIEIERTLRLDGCLGIFRINGPSMELFMGNLLVGDNADAPSPYDFAMGGEGMDGSLPVGSNGSIILPGNTVMVDMNGNFTGYMTDMTRTFFCGEPKPEYAAIHDLVRQANEAAEAMIHPGVRLCDIDAAARDLITKAGYGEYFNHRLGHFIGQTDHEKGDVSAANTDTVKPGMIFSIEPGVYLPGKFGVRVEDLVIVTETGCEVLNHVDKHWSVVGV